MKLLDVYPDGRAYNLDETIQRLRYRDGYEREVFMEPGRVYKVTMQPMTTSNYFAPGHRLRIEVSSSNMRPPRSPSRVQPIDEGWNRPVQLRLASPDVSLATPGSSGNHPYLL